MTACALPRFMFTCVPSGNVRLTPESMSQDSDCGADLSVVIGRNRLSATSGIGGICFLSHIDYTHVYASWLLLQIVRCYSSSVAFLCG